MTQSFPPAPAQRRLAARVRAALVALALPGLVAAAAPPTSPPPAPKAVTQQVAAKTRQVLDGSAPYVCPFCNLAGVDLSNQNLTNANLHGADLSNANLSGATLNGAELAGANLTGANLSNAVLDASTDGDADLSSANLSGAVFTGAQMQGTDLEYTDMSGADFSSADLTRARIGPSPRTGVHGGRKTSFRNAQLPAGLKLDAATSDSTGARRADASAPAAGTGAFEVDCGGSDLSPLTSAVYVATGGSDSGTCGTSLANACATIAEGISNCGASGCGVLVGYGQYPQTSSLALRAGVNVYGGCLPTGQSSSGLLSLIQAPAGGAPAVTATDLSAATQVQNFKISASAATVPGTPSIALQVSNSPGLVIAGSEIYAAQGATGNNGGAPGSATKGGDASGQSAGSNGSCGNVNGGGGAVQMAVSVDQGAFKFSCNPSCSANSCYGYWAQPGDTNNYAAGGQWGSQNCAECPVSSGGNGNGGGGGNNAGCGTKGTASGDTKGSFNGTAWTASSGGSGSAGGNGGGGGGGGSGGYKAGSCFWVKTEDPGNTGGGGGAGGCGGGAGGGAQQGGGSFAVVNASGALVIGTSRIIGGLGGGGGTGAGGAVGGGGGSGAGGASGGGGGTGGTGGNGGSGGGGGGGAGGNGGPAIGVALVGGATLSGSDLVFYTGAGGGGGGGGTGAASGAGGSVCTAGTGDGGNTGLAVDQQQF